MTSTAAAQRGEAGIANPQGTTLQAVGPALEGFHVDTSREWRHRGQAVRGVTTVDGELVVTTTRRLAGRDLVGTTFVATAPDRTRVEMRIARVMLHENPWQGPRSRRQRHDYVIEYRAPARGWRNLCPGAYRGATLIPGAFAFAQGSRQGSNGDFDLTRDRLTFSCRDGVAAKCVDWGYSPWDEAGEMARYFQSCTSMAMADYCGNGHSRTVDGTMINYGDLREPPVVKFKQLDGFVPEAVWGAGGPAGTKPAVVCLFRTRWSTLRIGPRSPCRDVVPDPREEQPAGGPGQFCEDLTLADWARQKGALFVNSSRMIDVGLFVWTDGAGHYVTTTRHPWLGKGVEARSPAGYPTFVSIEGASYKPTLRHARRRGLVPLYRYTKRNGPTTLHLTTTDASPGSGWRGRLLEAYVYAPSPEPPVSTAQKLYLYRDRHGAFATTSEATPPAGYGKDGVVLGWLPH
jgi:hypothetical protein